MSQPPPVDPRWVAMRARHQEEVGDFAREVAAAQREFNNHVGAAKETLLARHSQQEKDFYGLTPNTPGRTRSARQLVAPNMQPTAPNLSATPVYANQKLLPAPYPLRKWQPGAPSAALSAAYGGQCQKDPVTPSASAAQGQAEQQLKFSSKLILAQSQKSEQAPSISIRGQIFKPGQHKLSVTGPHRQPTLKMGYEVIDLCSDDGGGDDDDVLIEVTKGAYQKSTAVSTPILHSIQTATFQLFGEHSKKRFPTPEPLLFERENGEAGRSTYGQSRLPQLAQNRDSSNVTVSHATLPANKDLPALQQCKQSDGIVNYILGNEQIKFMKPSLGGVSTAKDSDDDVDMEDVPLALLNVKAALKQLGVTVSNNNNMDVDSSAPVIESSLKLLNDTQKTHLPTPPPSVASASATRQVSRAAALMNELKKPVTTGVNESTQVHTWTTRSSSCALAANMSPGKPFRSQLGISAASRISNTSTSSRKRRKVDLDDKQSTYSFSEYSPFTERKKSKINTPAVLKVQAPPPPSTSPVAPMGKKKNGVGFRTVTSSTPATPSRTPSANSNPLTSRTPTQASPYHEPQTSTVSLGKRNAAVRAQEIIQKINEADEEFHTNDQIFKATAREARKSGAVTSHLGQRLRSMSITPVPMDVHSGTSKPSRMPVAPMTPVNAATGARKNGRIYAKKGFVSNGATKARLAARSHNINQIIRDNSDEDFEDDLDISEFAYLNGIIVQAGQEGRLTEVQAKATSVKNGKR